jgi:hypothetical protein
MALARMILAVPDAVGAGGWQAASLVSIGSFGLSSTATSTDSIQLCGSNDNTAPVTSATALGNFSGFAGPSNQANAGTRGQALGAFAYYAVIRLGGPTHGLSFELVGDDSVGGVTSVGTTLPIVNTGTALAPVIAIPAPWNVRNVAFADSPVTAAGWDWLVCDTTGGNIAVTGPSTKGVTWGATKVSADVNKVNVSASVGNIAALAVQPIALQWGSLTMIGITTGCIIQSSN